MLKAGQTLLLPKPGHDVSHLWVLVLSSDPITTETVIVNLTTQRAHSDTTLVLQTGEHSFVKHPSAVHYGDARIVDGRVIEAAITAGTFPVHGDCSAALLKRIQDGLIASPFTPGKVKAYVKQRLSVA
jgi:hypothetical protein